MTDLLKMNCINSLPQPLIVMFCGGDEWPVYDIEVESGLIRIDVVGKLECRSIGEVDYFIDSAGVKHDAETFYNE